MSGERLSSHPNEADQEAASWAWEIVPANPDQLREVIQAESPAESQDYAEWAANDADHGQHLTSSIGSGSNGEKLAKLRQQLAAERGVPKFQTEPSSSATGSVSKETAHSDEAHGVHEAGKTPDTHETINPRRQQEEEAVGETAVEAADQPDQLPELPVDNGRQLDDVISSGIRQHELESASVRAYDTMSEDLQREMNARGRRHAMAEFGLGSDRQVAELSKTDRARYQQFLDRASQLTYQAADEYRQKVAPINKVKQEMGLGDNDKLSDLTVDRQIEAANQLSRVRDQQPRPSELRATSEAARSSELKPSTDLVKYDDEVEYDVPEHRQAEQPSRTPYVIDIDEAKQNQEVDQLMKEVHRSVELDREVDRIMKDIYRGAAERRAKANFDQQRIHDSFDRREEALAQQVAGGDVITEGIHRQEVTKATTKVIPLNQEQPATGASDSAEATTEPDTAEPTPASEAIDFNPMTAVSIDREQMADDKAWDEAQDRLDRELSDEHWLAKDENGKPVHRFGRIKAMASRLFKGNILRGYYERKYWRLAREKYQKIEQLETKDENGQPLSLEQLMEKAKSDARYALILRMGQQNERYVFREAGETREQLDEHDEAYVAMTKALRDFATRGEDGQWLMDLDAFNEEMNRVRAMQHDIDLDSKHGQNELKRLVSLDNYEAIAIYVRAQVEHGEALENVMQGFKMYAAESREGARTDEWRTLMESAMDKYQHSKLGQIIPAEWVVTAAGALSWLGGAVAKNKAVQIASLGGSAAVAGGLAALKESNQLKADRTLMARRLAMGANDESGKDYKYGDAIEGTMLNMAKSADLIQQIDAARESGDWRQMKEAMDQAILRQYISDSYGVDLIRYSSPDAVESERVTLLTHELQLEADYIAVARRLDPNFDMDKYRERLQGIADQIREVNDDLAIDRAGREFARTMLIGSGAATPEEVLERGGKIGPMGGVPSEALRDIADNIREQNKAFDKLRHRRMRRTLAKAAAISVGFSVGFQEVLAYFNDNVRGIVEGLNGQNADAASTTALEGLRDRVADMLGMNQAAEAASGVVIGTPRHIRAEDVSQQQLQEWRDKGYDVQEKWGTVNVTETKSISAAEAVQDNARISRAGWFDNGTGVSDYGELTGHNTGSGYIYNIADHYSSSNGLSVSGEQMLQTAQQGNLKLLLSPTSGTQMNPFEITGHVEGSQVIFDVQPGSPEAQMLASGSFHTAEVFDASNNMVLATEVGSGTANSLTTTITNGVDQIVSYDVTGPGAVADVASAASGVAEFKPLTPFIYSPVGHDVVQQLTYNQSQISQALPSINPMVTPWERLLNQVRNRPGGQFVIDTAQDQAEDAAETVITGAARRLSAAEADAYKRTTELTIDQINQSLGQFANEFGAANLNNAFGDLLTTENGQLVLSSSAREAIASHISTFTADVLSVAQQMANDYTTNDPNADRARPASVRQAARVQATAIVLRRYVGGA